MFKLARVSMRFFFGPNEKLKEGSEKRFL